MFLNRIAFFDPRIRTVEATQTRIPTRVRRVMRLLAMTTLAAGAQAAQAFVTVGPHGAFTTIQAGVNQADANGGDIVLVEVKLCTDVHGFQYVCPYVESITISANHSITLSGGWQSDFQTLSPNRTLIKGDGQDVQTLLVNAGLASGVTVNVSNFDIDGSQVTAQGNTGALRVYADGAVQVNIYSNSLLNNSKLTTGIVSGGAGIVALATTGAKVHIYENDFQSNQLLGMGTAGSEGGAALLEALQDSQIEFNNNSLTGNSVSNASGGSCHGGAVWAEASGVGAKLTLTGNTYAGNQQVFCTNGATGDAAEIHAQASAQIDISDEIWTSNNTGSNPGVYEVFMHADDHATIRAGNGLITHGTWGGLYAQTDATSAIQIVNFTIADNPVLGYNGIGPGTQLFNTILWNDGSPYSISGGATAGSSLTGDPKFVDATNGDYRLTLDSPAINAGYNDIPGGAYYYDLDGITRPYTGDGVAIADIGAYEYHSRDRIFRDGFNP